MNLGKSDVGEDERRKIGDGWLDRPEGVFFWLVASGRSSASEYLGWMLAMGCVADLCSDEMMHGSLDGIREESELHASGSPNKQ